MLTRRKLQILSPALAVLLLPAGCLYAQETPAPAAGGLTITILEGDNAIMNVRQRVNREAIVQVTDENHKPVAGAAVTFLAPGNGASATFAGGTQTLTVTTNADGRAVLRGIRPNQSAGRYQIRVNASSGGRTASATINQTNTLSGAVSAGGLSTKAIIAIIAGGAAGAAVGIIVGTGGGGSNTPTVTPTSLAPGNPSVTGPSR